MGEIFGASAVPKGDNVKTFRYNEIFDIRDKMGGSINDSITIIVIKASDS